MSCERSREENEDATHILSANGNGDDAGSDQRSGLRVFRVGGPGDDTLIGTNGFDTLLGAGGDDTVRGLSGADELAGGPDKDVIYGGPGDDFVQGDDIFTRQTATDVLYRGDGKDYVDGWRGDDVQYGESGRDYVTGGPGEDILYGGDGNDFVDAIDGLPFEDLIQRDWLYCGNGIDKYVANRLDYVSSSCEERVR
jgi:Ca2+-binding RTX toxin-like protein